MRFTNTHLLPAALPGFRTVAVLLTLLVVSACGGADDDTQNANCAAVAAGDGPGGRLLVASDADLLATAVIDNQLGPPVAGTSDSLSLIDPRRPATIVASSAVPNSVTGPVWILAASPDGSRVYVVETNRRPQGATTRAELLASPSDRLTVVNVCGGRVAAMASIATASSPTTVSMRPDGSALAVSARAPARLVVHPVDRDGVPSAPLDVALPAAALPDPGAAPSDQEISYAGWSPDGQVLAVAIRATRKLVFLRAEGRGAALRFQPLGDPVEVDEGTFGGAWSPDGRYFYANNVRLLARPINELINGPGAGLTPEELFELAAGSLQVIQLDGPANAGPQVIQTELTPVFPEGMNISPDGRFVATVNILASPFPVESPLYSPYGSVSMWSRDPASGRLSRLGDTPFEGILPEGAAFSPDSRYFAVASFHAGGTDRERGAVDIWRITDEAGAPLALHGRVLTPRGAHAVTWLP